ncbi:hypothetical protein [Bordetella sp. N]|uniref:hypothetical protein n=1 Tax=Bordetella sp. N TaxID=1746199 RepID=UPI00070DF414|nr:hypothetical protein [Bordetella sp. N]ALM84606.1 hypothetical protein ASB57_17920 [Bordetella sp. N]
MMECFSLLLDGCRIALSTGIQDDGLFAWKLYLYQLASPASGALVAAGTRCLTRPKAEEAGMSALMEYRTLRLTPAPAGVIAAVH